VSGIALEVCTSALETLKVIHAAGTVLNPSAVSVALPDASSSSTRKVEYQRSPLDAVLPAGGLDLESAATHKYRPEGTCRTLHGTSHDRVEAVFRFKGSKHHTPLAEWWEGSVGSAALPVCGSSFR
jgi:hypothetical protein